MSKTEFVNEWTDHECTHPEVLVANDDGDLAVGMAVLVPCPRCGETPLDHVAWLSSRAEEATKALLEAMPVRILYHWSPAARRKQIIRYGLRPRSRGTTSTVVTPVICLADSPSWAWALSGEQRHSPAGEWDLWQTRLDAIEDPIVLPGRDRLSGIYEVRTEHRIFKRNLWLVGSRSR